MIGTVDPFVSIKKVFYCVFWCRMCMSRALRMFLTNDRWVFVHIFDGWLVDFPNMEQTCYKRQRLVAYDI